MCDFGSPANIGTDSQRTARHYLRDTNKLVQGTPARTARRALCVPYKQRMDSGST